MKSLRILGIRGIPAAHGGFETFAERLALYLVGRGWRVVVYCQREGQSGQEITEDEWQGVQRVHVPVAQRGSLATVVFDWKAVCHAAAAGDLCLTLGYNTAVFCQRLRMAGVPNLINMDGIEWQRAKWGPLTRVWFRVNERAGCWLADHLIADHPLIAKHLAKAAKSSKITMIPYGADRVAEVPAQPLAALGVESGRFLSLIARAEPENSVLEAVQGFSRSKRGFKLVVLGNYAEDNPYHRAVKAAASADVVFAGAIYDKTVVQAIRCHSLAYVHGHRVGGTNPSLVEALGAGNPVLAHDNGFNRWVAGEAARYFSTADDFDRVLSALLAEPQQLAALRANALKRFQAAFTWSEVLDSYESLLTQWLPSGATVASRHA